LNAPPTSFQSHFSAPSPPAKNPLEDISGNNSQSSSFPSFHGKVATGQSGLLPSAEFSNNKFNSRNNPIDSVSDDRKDSESLNEDEEDEEELERKAMDEIY